MTLVFSPAQAILAAESGRLLRLAVPRPDRRRGGRRDARAAEICELYAVQGYDTKVLAASLRHPMHVVEAALAGADIATMPYDVFTKLVKHPLTDLGLERFQADWRPLQDELRRARDRKRGITPMETSGPTERPSRSKLLPELQQIAETLGVEGAQKLRKAGLIDAIVEAGRAPTASGQRRSEPALPERCDGGRRERRRRRAVRAPGRGTTQAPRRRRRSVRSQPAPSPGGGDGRRGVTAATEDDRDRGGDGGGHDRERRPRAATAVATVATRRRRRRDPPVRIAAGSARSAGRARRPSAPRSSQNAPTPEGILDMLPEGYGFLRTSGYLPGPDDIYVSVVQVAQAFAPQGRQSAGKVRRPREQREVRRAARGRARSTAWIPSRRRSARSSTS